MSDSALELPFEAYEKWMAELDVDWPKVLREAELGKTQQYVIKDRWGTNQFQMAKIHSALKRIELKRKERTSSGAVMLALEEWNRIGVALAREPAMLQKEIEQLRGKAETAIKIADARKTLAEHGALASPTPEPKRPRK